MSPAGFACDLDGFKRQVAKFCQRAEGGEYSAEALDLGMRTLRLHYLNLQGDGAAALIATSYLEHAARRYAAAILH